MRERGRDQIEVHVAGVCVRFQDGRWQLLAGKRTRDRSLFPGLWECGGGHVRKGEDLQSAVRRQIFEEFGLDVVPQYTIEAYSILVPQGVIPGVRFLCIAKEGNIKLDRGEFSEYRWLDLPAPDLDWIPGLKDVLDACLSPANLDPLVNPRKTPPSKQIGFIADDKKGRLA